MHKTSLTGRQFPPIILAFLLIFTTFFASTETNVRYHINLDNRIGFGLSTKADAQYWANQLNASWYLDWKTTAVKNDQFPEYWQMIRLSPQGYRPSRIEIIALAIEYPGHTWIIGNEPDNIYQDNITAEEYASFYHELYYLIKRFDPTAKVATGAVSQATPLRLDYLNEVLTVYSQHYQHQMPVDWWTLHAYILREEDGSWGAGISPGMNQKSGTLYSIEDHADLELFKENIRQFRLWMNNNGYQNKPLAITEFGILLPAEFGSSPMLVANYLQESFKWLLGSIDKEIGYPADQDRLVQKFAWFSLADTVFPVADLADISAQTLTLTGEAFLRIANNPQLE